MLLAFIASLSPEIQVQGGLFNMFGNAAADVVTKVVKKADDVIPLIPPGANSVGSSISSIASRQAGDAALDALPTHLRDRVKNVLNKGSKNYGTKSLQYNYFRL